MSLAKDWGRQTARAAGVSLIAPLALLGGAATVGASGGGLGGLGSLTQIASGPSLPRADLAAAPRSSSLGRAQVVALQLGKADAPRSAPAPTGAGAPPVPSIAAGPSPSGGAPGGQEVALTPEPPQVALQPIAPSPVPGGRPPAPPPAAPAPPAPPPVAPAPNLVADLIDTTRGVGESLPAPLGPTVGDTLDLVLGPRP